MRFRTRLVGAVTGVTMVTLGGAFATISHLVNSDQQRQLDTALRKEAREEARESDRGGNGTQLLISDGPGPYANDLGPLTKYAAIFDGDGIVLSHTDTFSGRVPAQVLSEHPLDECFDFWLHREHVRAVLTAVPNHPGHLLLLATPRLDLDSDSAFLHKAMMIVFAVAVAWAAAVATWVVRRLTRGHAAVASVARKVADGDLSARVAPDTSDPEMTQLAADVNQMIARLAALLRTQEEFITHAAHELRSPLTTLDGELAHALRRDRDEGGYRRAIEEARESTLRLKELAENLLTLARIEGRAAEPDEDVVLTAVLERAKRAVSGEAARHEVAIEVGALPSTLRGHPHDLERLFCNLLENAIRHSPHGGRVRVDGSTDGPVVRLKVSDEGSGVPEADQGRIFEPFYRSPSAYGRPGHGLGLAIARKIARAHGGELALEKSAIGAVFVVELPS